MKTIHVLFSGLFLVACNHTAQQETVTQIAETSPVELASVPTKISIASSPTLPGLDTTYRLSVTHTPYQLTGFFDADTKPDTVWIVRHVQTGNDALYIKHSQTNSAFLLTNGKDVGDDFENFNWTDVFERVPKGSTVWSNVQDGDIVDETQVPDSEKIRLQTDGILLHVSEGCGGGIIYFSNGKYHWVQQE